MKIRKINLLLAVTCGAFFSLVGCTKNDGPITSRISIETVPIVSTNIDATTANISLAAPSAFSGKYTVSMYIPGNPTPTKIDLVIRKSATAATANNNNVKVYKANAVTTYPTTFTITAAEITALFGAPLVLNEVYDVAPNIYVGDKLYEAFPLGVTGTGAGIAQMPLFGEYARFTVKP